MIIHQSDFNQILSSKKKGEKKGKEKKISLCAFSSLGSNKRIKLGIISRLMCSGTRKKCNRAKGLSNNTF